MFCLTCTIGPHGLRDRSLVAYLKVQSNCWVPLARILLWLDCMTIVIMQDLCPVVERDSEGLSDWEG